MQKPYKLLLVRTGNIRTRELTALLKTPLATIIKALETNTLVELDRSEVRIVV